MLHGVTQRTGRLAVQTGRFTVQTGRFAVHAGAVCSADRRFAWSWGERWRAGGLAGWAAPDRKSTRLNSCHLVISYAVFCLENTKYASAYRDSCGARLARLAILTVFPIPSDAPRS